MAPLVVLGLLAGPGTAAAADLAVSAPFREDADPLTVGSLATYQFEVRNNGPEDVEATAVVTLGEAEELVDVGTAQGSCTRSAPVVCSLGTILAGANASVRVQVRFTRTAAANSHHVQVSGPAGSVDPDPSNNQAAQVNPVTEHDRGDAGTPAIRIEDSVRTQAKLIVDAEVEPYGDGEVYFEYGRTKAYGSKTKRRKVSGDQTSMVQGVIRGLRMNTRYHYRAVLVVNGKTYRSKNATARTMGKLKFAELTMKAVKRTPSSVTYTGTLGDGFADAPGACKGNVKVIVITMSGAELLVKSTRMRSSTCSYRITVPFGRKQASRYGKRGSVLSQARFSGSKAVSAVGSKVDRP